MLYHEIEVKKMQKSKIAKIVEILFKIIWIGGLVCLPFIPKLYDLLKVFNIPNFNNQTIYYKIAFYLCYIICLGIIFMLDCVFKTIYKDTPFSKKIEKYLKIISILFMSLSIIILIKVIYIPTVLSFAVIVVSMITSLCFYTLSQIFKIAINYKNEVDYTI